MADSGHCEHCDMSKAYCPHGNAGAAQAVREEFSRAARRTGCTEGEFGPTIDASIPGECVTCGGRIEVGSRITHISEGWVHADLPARSNDVSFEGF